jgi:hypothetical protein
LNGGELKFGDITKVINDYQNTGFDAVTRRNIHYRLKQYAITGNANLHSEISSPAIHVLLGTDAPVSELSDIAGSSVQVDEYDLTGTSASSAFGPLTLEENNKRKVSNQPEKRVTKK